MNLVARQNFGRKSSPAYNTEIGGVSGTITTASALATKLAIDVSRISNFTIVGSDIKCKITGSYAIPSSAFQFNTTPCTYYRDTDYLITSVGNSSFYAMDVVDQIKRNYDFQNCTIVYNLGLKRANAENILLKNCTSLENDSLSENAYIKRTYIPNVTTIGSSPSVNNSVFSIISGSIIYAHPSMATINSGGVEADLAYAISQGVTVRYVTNFTAPNPVTGLSAGTIYNTAIQLNFTTPSSTNAIDYYELYNNGVFVKNITVSGEYITGLTPSTSYNITLIAVDVFYNKSVVSNILSVSTTNTTLDADANAYMIASNNGRWQLEINNLYTSLKSNSLYTKIQAFYPFLGTTASQHKWNGKNPLDTNAAFRLTFSGGGTFSDNGYQCNGSNAYANTYLVPSLVQNVNSNGLTLACGTNNAAASSNVVEIGAYNSASQASYLMIKNNNTNYKRRTALCNETPEVSQTGINESIGVFTGSRQSSTNTDLFVNGSQVATANQGGSLPTFAIFIGALNIGSAVTFSNQRIQFTAIHEGLSDAEVATLHTIIDTFETAIGRKTW